MNFSFLALDLKVDLPECRGNLANFLRGQLGAALRRFSCTCKDPEACERSCDYGRIFDPPRDTNVPSGLRDPLRPFVLRPRSKDSFTIHIFDVRGDMAETIVKAVKPVSASVQEVVTDLSPRPIEARELEIRFLTPTDIRCDIPAFATVFARARDRVSTLRALYGEGPLPIDHKQLGEMAQSVRLLRSDVELHAITRRSGTTGQVHTIGGFTGKAIYAGEFSPFYPILEAAQFTGIGRKTVWGNGQFSVKVVAQ